MIPKSSCVYLSCVGMSLYKVMTAYNDHDVN